MKNFFKLLVILGCFFCWFTLGCNQPEGTTQPSSVISDDSLDEQLTYAHQTLSSREEKLINQYIARHELKLIKTSSGLRYTVYHPGKGANAKPSDIVRVRYDISMINGIRSYSTDEDGPKEIRIGQTEAVSGLHELLQYVNRGAKARAIIPSYLAYGFTGDQERIPKGATLVFDLEVLDIITTQ